MKNNTDDSSSDRAQKTRPTIGYLTNGISDDTGQALWSGVIDGARAFNLNVICFPGRCLSDPRDFQAQANILYDLPSAEFVAGIASWASSIGTYVDGEANRTFHQRYRPLPVVPIGGDVEGFPSLLIDGYSGMRAAVTHLIEAHGCCHLAFIRGPESHSQAQERYRAYLETLEAHGLPSDPQLVTPPHHWEHATGVAGMRLLLDERKLRPHTDFDAIVAASDVLLLGALQVLQERGIQVPEEIAAVSFNNSIQGRTHTPPLTSVAAPFHEMGYQSVEALVNSLQGAPISRKMLVPKLVIRQSCGCVDPAIAQASAADQGAVSGAAFESILASEREQILSKMVQAVGESTASIEPGWEGHLLDGFVGELNGTSSGIFLKKLNATLRQAMTSGDDMSVWHGPISALRRETALHLEGAALRRAEDLWHQARVLISGVIQRAQAYQSLQAAQRAQALREVESALLTTFDVPGLMGALATSLPRLGIPSCYLSLYEAPQLYKYPQPAPEWSRLRLACTEKGCAELEPGGQRFRSHELVPKGMWPQGRQYSFVVEPLYFQEQQLGFVLFEVGPRDGGIYEILRSLISSVLKGALLIQEQQQTEDALMQERDGLKLLVMQIQKSANGVTAASTEILASATQMASVTEEQASAVNQITATVQEIKASSDQVAQQAQGVAESAERAAAATQKGIAAVKAAIEGMGEIQKKVEAITENILALSEQTQQIGNIIDTVTDIAGQSNILALNAAIEAAHAGELGARFRVVADEVKNLAGQSRQAAKQVRVILEDIEKAAKLTVVAAKQGTDGVNTGSGLVSKVAQTIDELAQAAKVSAQAAELIAVGVQQQTLGLDQIAVGMQDINAAAQQSAATGQQSRKAAQDLNELAERLRQVVSQYQS